MSSNMEETLRELFANINNLQLSRIKQEEDIQQLAKENAANKEKIAELETTMDDLQFQLATKENELTESKLEINSLKNCKPNKGKKKCLGLKRFPNCRCIKLFKKMFRVGSAGPEKAAEEEYYWDDSDFEKNKQKTLQI